MPRATVNTEDTDRFELKTLPKQGEEEAGFVVLKRMSFGQLVARRAMMKMSVDMGNKKNKDIKGELAMASREVTQFEFRQCIVDHNLEDPEGRTLNFTNLMDFESLDPKV